MSGRTISSESGGAGGDNNLTDQLPVISSDIAQLQAKNLALEMALQNEQIEKQKLQSSQNLSKLKALPELKIIDYKNNRDSIKRKKICSIQMSLLNCLAENARVIRFDKNGFLPKEERELDEKRDREVGQLRKQLNEILVEWKKSSLF